MAKFELTKTVEGIRVNKKTGIQLGERVNLSFGAIIEDPREDRDNLRFLHMGEMFDVKLADVDGYYKPIGGPADAAPPKATPPPPAEAKSPAKAADPRFVKFENIPSNLTVNRAKVPGGWLVAVGHGAAFVPDANHEWDGSSL